MSSIPVGTPCYFVRQSMLIDGCGDLIGHVCTVCHIGGCDTKPGKVCGPAWFFGQCPSICSVKFGDGTEICIDAWSQLRPITPPAEKIDARTTEEIGA